MKLNGTDHKLDKSQTLDEFLKARGYNPAIVAVELNGQIISKGEYENTIVDDRAAIEVVRFVGGG
ncbi:sulfur carrier protein ThiS [Ruminiclostridium cellobioparum]|jgi:sulfur carrier protein|uniref:sulfur carrier protein ThiS n=2 Tax=Ruminiclostridium cellobioparum TaxID=29355 RepID=UPI000483FE1C|nr:sulfur carrier protein ThiS [Ruminiclostridium cellobioparum]